MCQVCGNPGIDEEAGTHLRCCECAKAFHSECLQESQRSLRDDRNMWVRTANKNNRSYPKKFSWPSRSYPNFFFLGPADRTRKSFLRTSNRTRKSYLCTADRTRKSFLHTADRTRKGFLGIHFPFFFFE